MRPIPYHRHRPAFGPSQARAGNLARLLPTALLLCLLLALGGPRLGHAEESGARTVFLPLKINAPTASADFAARLDQAFRDALGDKGITFLPRETVAAKVNYLGNWPPDFLVLQEFAPSADHDYLATGSVTVSGSRLSLDLAVFDLLEMGKVKYLFAEGDASGELKSVAAALSKELTAYIDRGLLVASVTIRGNKKIDTGAIEKKVTVKSGDRYLPQNLRADLKNIHKLGYFDDVQLLVEESESGKKIVFEVKEKAVIGTIKTSGQKELEESAIKEVMTVSANKVASDKDIQDTIDKIKKLYKEKGFYNTEVTVAHSNPKAGIVDLLFEIKEGSKVYIKEITLVGNKAFPAKKLKEILQTSEKGFFSWITDSGVLKRDLVKQDAAKLTAYYHNNGYVDAKIGEPEISQKDNWLHLTFNIDEGERYKVGKVDLGGDLIEEKAALLALLKTSPDKFFSSQALRDDILALTDRYAEKGFAFAEAVPATQKDPANKKIDLSIELAKKQLVHLNRIVIKGNSRTRDKVIRRELEVKEAEVFNATALKKSHAKLQRLDYFEEVNVNPEPTGDEGLMDVMVEVKEKPTGNFSIGAGYSSMDSFMFMSEISENNFLGRGQNITLQANVSGKSTQYNLGITEPHLADSKLMAGLDLYDWMRKYDEYTKNSTGSGVRFGYPIWNEWNLFANYAYDDTNLTDVLPSASQIIRDSMEIRVTSSIKLGVNRDLRDNRMNPSKGTFHNLTVKYAGGPLGGDSQFTKLEGNTNWYYPLPWETTFHTKLAAGLTVENVSGKLPIYEKFYLGGLNSIRGFKSSYVSPRDPITQEKVGGDKMWYYNMEWIFPLVADAGLKGLLFFDAGNVYSVDTDWNFNDFKKSAGLGFRWLSPMGPLRLEWGKNLDPKNGEDTSNWDFSIGGSF